MKIEFIPKSGFRGILTICVEGEEWKDVHSTIFGRNPELSSSGISTMAELENKFQKEEYRLAKFYALKRLALKSQPSTELIKSFQERLVSDAVIQQVVSDCRRLGYLNDKEWMDAFVRGQIARKIGPQAIVRKMISRGISHDTAEEIVAGLDSGDSQQERILALLNTRFSKRNLTDPKERQKVVASLCRKGFPLSIILETVRSKIRKS